MRSDQLIGLTPAAQALTRGRPVPAYTRHERRVYPDGSTDILPPVDITASSVVSTPYADEPGAWADVAGVLYRHTLTNSPPPHRVLEEYVQATPWSSGPMYFIALRDATTGQSLPETLWSADEMSEY
jgi:hypothetical protein